MIEKLFKENNLKLTKQRKLIYEIISNNNEEATLKTIISKCNNKLNITTIYRVLDIFLENNLIKKKIDLSKEVYYEIIPHEHIHYINCIKCHNKTKIDPKEIELFEKKVSKDYKLISHDIDFTGICKECMQKH